MLEGPSPFKDRRQQLRSRASRAEPRLGKSHFGHTHALSPKGQLYCLGDVSSPVPSVGLCEEVVSPRLSPGSPGRSFSETWVPRGNGAGVGLPEVRVMLGPACLTREVLRETSVRTASRGHTPVTLVRHQDLPPREKVS